MCKHLDGHLGPCIPFFRYPIMYTLYSARINTIVCITIVSLVKIHPFRNFFCVSCVKTYKLFDGVIISHVYLINIIDNDTPNNGA